SPASCGPLDTGAIEAPVDGDCTAPPPTGTFTPVVEWRDESIGPAYTTPVVGQLTDDDGDGDVDGDDTPDIVVSSAAGTMVAVSGDGSGTHWSVPNLGSEPATAALGDLDGDGDADVAVAGNGFVGAVNGQTGAVQWLATDLAINVKPVCGGVGIADLDGNGKAEVVLGNLIFDGRTGGLRGTGPHGIGSGHSSALAAFGVAADIDADGDQEVVVGNALYDIDGNALWFNGQPDGFVAVANFDDDVQGEIVVSWFPGNVRLQDDDGSVAWQVGPNLTGPTIGPPTVADFDGDGEPEIGVAGNNVYVVLETDGSTKWTRAVQDFSSGFTGSSVFDFEGDGKAEVVYADENDVWVFDGATGAVKLQQPEHSSATCSEYPSVADVDGDGHAEIVYTSSAYSGPENGLRVIGDLDDSWMTGREWWNQHGYAITNIGGDGVAPADPLPNWPSYNNFRSGDVTAVTGNRQADASIAAGDACDLQCGEGHLYVVVHVGNAGADDLPAGVPVTVWTARGSVAEALATWRTPAALSPGQGSVGHRFDLDPAQIGDRLWAVADDDGTGAGTVDECHEDNNEVELTLCP
ncbi:MAG: FG-GAP-like repeat-containing protein, partial [Myxococcota bacterium]